MTRRHLLSLIVIAAGVVLVCAVTFEVVQAWAGATSDVLGPLVVGFGLIAFGAALVVGVVLWGRRGGRAADTEAAVAGISE